MKEQEKGKPENQKPKPEKSRDSDEPRKKVDLSKYLKDDEDEKKPEQETGVEQAKSVRFTKSSNILTESGNSKMLQRRNLKRQHTKAKVFPYLFLTLHTI